MMNRREFIGTSAVVAATAALKRSTALGKNASSAQKRPNIVLVIADQMNIDAISAYRDVFKDEAYGAHHIETPNLDWLIENGVSFKESHSTDPVCCPARASLFTGRMSCETGVFYNNIGIAENIPNLGQWLEQHTGYSRYYCGKWHAGGAWNCPTVDGARKIPGFETIPTDDSGVGRVLDYQVAASLEAFIRNHDSDKPYLLVGGFLNPHDCCFWNPHLGKNMVTSGTDYFELGKKLPPLPPNQDVNNRGGIPEEQWTEMHWKNYIYDYLRQIETLDKNLGRIVSALRDRDDDTVLIFTADHGDECGRHRRISKWQPFQASVMVPLIVYGPKAGIRKGVIDAEHLVSGVDLFPTICDFAGIEPTELCRGESLRPILTNVPAAWRAYLYYSYQHTGRVIRSKKYKYVMKYAFSNQKSKKPGDGKADHPFIDDITGQPAAFIPGQGDRCRREAGRTMLFDMEDDDWEMNNLAGNPEFASVIAEHEAELKKWEDRLEINNRFDRN
jgi:arylsulfatase A-like enzyme